MQKEYKILFGWLSGNPVGYRGLCSEESLYEIIVRHRLFNFVPIAFEMLPESWCKELKVKGEEYTRRSLLLTRELVDLDDTLCKADLDYILLKGPALSRSLYGDFGIRPFNDLDLLVPETTFFKVYQVLSDLGYHTLYPRKRIQHHYQYYSRHKRDIGLIHPETRTLIELHFGINAHRIIPGKLESEFLLDTQKTAILDRSIQVLSPEKNFLYLCFHGAHHLFFRLFWLKDISRSLESWHLNPSQVLSLSRRYGMERFLAVSLVLSEDIFGSSIPDAYREICSSQKVQILVKICKQRITGPETETGRMKILKQLYFLMLKPGIRHKTYVITSIFHRWYIHKFLGGH